MDDGGGGGGGGELCSPQTCPKKWRPEIRGKCGKNSGKIGAKSGEKKNSDKFTGNLLNFSNQ